jgi:2,3-dihydroxyphenylpropionate 1,2-dioxygenase
MFLAVSHSPIILMRARPPEEEPLLLDHLERAKEAIERFDPEVIVFFGTDHFAGFHLSLMPSFCIGLGTCEAVDDAGGSPGPLAVDEEGARALVLHLRDEGFDPAISHKMTVDHAFSQPLFRLFGRNDRYPVIPVFISVLTPPFAPFRRSRLFGEAVGRFVRASGRRTLILGTGGLSHHPTRYYPDPAQAQPEVRAYQLDGERGGGLTDAQWFERLHRMHTEGAEMLISGARTRKDIRLNPEMDQLFLGAIGSGELELLDGQGGEAMIEHCGIGWMENHSWIAAAAASRAAGDPFPVATVYAPTLEYGIGYGMAYTAQR